MLVVDGSTLMQLQWNQKARNHGSRDLCP